MIALHAHFSDNLISSLFTSLLLFVCVVRNPAFLEWGFLLTSNYNKMQSREFSEL